MKRLKYILLVLVILLLSSCDTTSNLVEPEINQQRSSAEYIAQIEEMGFNPETIVELEDSYLVEGDIRLTKRYLDDEIGVLSKTEQRMTYYLVKWSDVNSIRIKIDSSMPSSGVDNWRPEISQAISAWNAISSSKIYFQLVTSSPDITIRSDGGSLGDGTIASASFPNSAGTVGPTIDVNLDYYNNKTVSSAQKKWNIAHEIGHCIGFWHTQTSHGYSIGQNNYGGFIPRTPTTDNNSMMLAWSAEALGSSITNFSYYDQVGAKVLYPSTLTATITGIQLIPNDDPPYYRDYNRINFTHNGLYAKAELWGRNENTLQWAKLTPLSKGDTYFDLADDYGFEITDAYKIRLDNPKTNDKYWESSIYYK